MSAVRSKDHHFVPQTLLRQFCFREEEIWFSKKDASGNYTNPELQRIDKAFLGRNLYTIIYEGESSDVVERKYYGEADNYLGGLIPKVKESFAKGIVPDFYGTQLKIIRDVVLLLIKRTPDFHFCLDPVEADIQMGKTLITQTVAAYSEAGLPETSDLMELKRSMYSNARLRSLGGNIRVRATLNTSEKIRDALDEFSVRWGVVNSKSSFIISSIIALRVGNGGPAGFANPLVEIWVPITPKIALILVRDPTSLIPLENKVSTDLVRRLNEISAKRSTCIGSHSRKLIESLTRKKSRFGEVLLKDRGKLKR